MNVFIKRHIAKIGLTLITLIVILFIYFNPLNVINNYSEILIIFISVLIFILGISWSFLNNISNYFSVQKKNYYSLLFYSISSIIGIIVFSLIIYNILYIILNSYNFYSIFIILFNVLILIIFLALIYLLIEKFIDPESTFGIIYNLLFNIIFYIPCIFLNIIEILKNEYKITTKTIWIILLIEILIISIRIILPSLYNYYYKNYTLKDGYFVQKKPLYLNEENILGIFQNYNSDDNNKFKYNFAISSKLWLNPQPDSTNNAYSKSTTILNYGDIIKINYNRDKLEIFAATTKNNTNNNNTNLNKLIKIYSFSNILYQRWNNIIINYTGGTLDIFINKKLILSKINITPILNPNKIVSGSDNGIHGGIKDIIFFNRILNKNDINTLYYN